MAPPERRRRLNELTGVDVQGGEEIGDFNGSGFSRVVFLTQNDDYGNGAQASIEQELQAAGHRYEKVAEEAVILRLAVSVLLPLCSQRSALHSAWPPRRWLPLA